MLSSSLLQVVNSLFQNEDKLGEAVRRLVEILFQDVRFFGVPSKLCYDPCHACAKIRLAKVES